MQGVRPRTLASVTLLVLLGAAAVQAALELDPAKLETWKLPEASLYGVEASGQNAC